mgnify:CR=1 FL=1
MTISYPPWSVGEEAVNKEMREKYGDLVEAGFEGLDPTALELARKFIEQKVHEHLDFTSFNAHSYACPSSIAKIQQA